jgi:hypothetical protein
MNARTMEKDRLERLLVQILSENARKDNSGDGIRSYSMGTFNNIMMVNITWA